MEQALWDAAVVVFTSDEYPARGKNRETVVADAFRGLLWSEGVGEEKAYLLGGALTIPQILHEIASSVEFVSMVRRASPGDGRAAINTALAEIYMVMLDRLPEPDELQGVAACGADEGSYSKALLSLVYELAVSDEFKKLAVDSDNASWRLDKALEGLQP